MAEKAEYRKPKTAEGMTRLILDDGRYPLDAFEFLHEGLELAGRRVYGNKAEPARGRRHVTGAQLCEAARDLALERWGPLALTVLRRWRIGSTIDFGHMVYLLVNNDFMQKTDEDSLEDFRDVYDFGAAFPTRGDFELKE